MRRLDRLRIKWRQFWCQHYVYWHSTMRRYTCDKCAKVWTVYDVPIRYMAHDARRMRDTISRLNNSLKDKKPDEHQN